VVAVAKKQQIVNKSLLSFDQEGDYGDEEAPKVAKKKIASSHDVLLADPTLSSKTAVDEKVLEQQKAKKFEQI
jgi:hypothetical protein